MIVCSFSGAVADLPPRRRQPENMLRALIAQPLVSVWDHDTPWLRKGLQSLVRHGLVMYDSTPQYPWVAYRVTDAGRDWLKKESGDASR